MNRWMRLAVAAAFAAGWIPARGQMIWDYRNHEKAAAELAGRLDVVPEPAAVASRITEHAGMAKLAGTSEEEAQKAENELKKLAALVLKRNELADTMAERIGRGPFGRLAAADFPGEALIGELTQPDVEDREWIGQNIRAAVGHSSLFPDKDIGGTLKRHGETLRNWLVAEEELGDTDVHIIRMAGIAGAHFSGARFSQKEPLARRIQERTVTGTFYSEGHPWMEQQLGDFLRPGDVPAYLASMVGEGGPRGYEPFRANCLKLVTRQAVRNLRARGAPVVHTEERGNPLEAELAAVVAALNAPMFEGLEPALRALAIECADIDRTAARARFEDMRARCLESADPVPGHVLNALKVLLGVDRFNAFVEMYNQ
jgi:hypothetical protein